MSSINRLGNGFNLTMADVIKESGHRFLDVRPDGTSNKYRVLPVANGFSDNITSSLALRSFILSLATPINSIYITRPVSATTLRLSSTSASDSFPAGTGALAVQIAGLDENWDEITEIVLMAGTSGTTATTQQFIRVNQLLVVAAGSNTFNVGNIYCSPSSDGIGGTTAGVPNTFIYNTIGALRNLSTTALYSVPRAHTFLPLDFQFSSNSDANKEIRLLGYFHFNSLGIPPFESTQISFVQGVTAFNVDTFSFPEKTDYYLTCNATGAQPARLKHYLSGALVKNSAVL